MSSHDKDKHKLFDVFGNDQDGDDDASDASSDAEQPALVVPPPRKRSPPESASQPADYGKGDKKARLPLSDAPIVADTFETQATAEFAPAKVDAETGTKLEPSADGEEKKVVLAHQIRHQVAIPPGFPYVPIADHVPPKDPARTYPFTLDPFQQVSVYCIDRNESVLVSAHTSAGKTVIAEYAIATALRNKQRVIYTSPIKALSNQKYREMLAEFGDVGLMTGDVTINPSASCLVMTTEILRSMLYRGSEVMREVAWVVFDEIHYMRDKSRGVVWEETIILLPHKVRHVFLSATIPNAKQFAEWICKIHHQPCHVVYTDFRPVPLQHYVFPAGGDGIHLCVDEKGQFRDDNFLKAIGTLSDTAGGNRNAKNVGRRGGRKDPQGKSDLFKIVKMIWSRNYQPVIVFAFSKRDCEGNALQMSKLNFNDETEKDLVTQVYKNAIATLSEDDQQLPQIQHLLPLLQRGIGIHHSGLLQILKEVIEILFQEGLIKVLFATETFSIGLNMPAKTVVFTSVRKWDGVGFRWVSSGEYIQMSGRAGRRGLDDRGIVILMLDEKMEPEAAKTMLKGEADVLNSAFHLTYNMILNLMRVDGAHPEYMLEHSFFQFQNNESVPQLQSTLEEMEAQRDAIVVDREQDIAEFWDIRQQLEQYAADVRHVMHHPDYCLPFLQPGRLVKVANHEGNNYGWGVIVNFTKKKLDKKLPNETVAASSMYLVDVLVYCAKDSTDPCPEDERGEMQILAVELPAFHGLSSVRAFLPKDLRNADSRNQVQKSINEIKRRFPDGVPLLDPVQDMNIKDKKFTELLHKIKVLEDRMHASPLKKPENRELLKDLYEQYACKMEIVSKVKELKKEIRRKTEIMQLEELRHRKRVLRKLGYTTQADVIEMKGRVACEISTGDELVLTEMIFNGVFNNLTVPQAVSLLSCFVFDERSNEVPKLRQDMTDPIRMLHETARRIAKISIECKITLDEDEYVESFRSELVDIVYAWCEGAKFAQICKMTDIFEGSIIRAMRRLEELIRQMVAAAKQIGNVELEKKFAEGGALIKRDIVFAASLYL